MQFDHHFFFNVKKNICIFLIFFSFEIIIPAQSILNISQFISENKISPYHNQALILVDFWATWCVPCEIANRHLETIQESVKDEIFMLSIANENAEAIDNHVKKMKMNLCIVADDNYKSFNRYGITALPSTIIFNQQGNIVWQGHPSDLSTKFIHSLFIQQTPVSRKKELSNFYTLNTPTKLIDTIVFVQPGIKEKEIVVQSNITDTCIIQKSDAIETSFYIEDNQVFFNGKINDLLGMLNQISKHQVYVKNDINTIVQVQTSYKNWIINKEKIIQQLSQQFKLKIGKSKHIFHAWVLKPLDPNGLKKFMSKDQNKQSGDNYMIDESSIVASQMSISKMSSVLGNVLSTIVLNELQDNFLYEWNLHYASTATLKKEFLDMGILLKKSITLKDVIVVQAIK